MRFNLPAVLIAALLAAPAMAQPNEAKCELLPKNVREAAVYSGFSESRMCDAGLPPLWKGLPENTASVMRFTFSSGHSMFWRTVTITQLSDGSARLDVVGGDFARPDVRSPWRDLKPVRRTLSADELASVQKLASDAGAFEHEIGTWDKRPEGSTEIFLHCQLLEMERVDSAGYRFSSVNIGCNRPSRLMPLVDAIIDRGGIAMVRGNWAGYSD